jgi:SSS family solute:Na+ symporter
VTLTVIDTTIVFFYIAGMLALGAILGKYVRSAKDYFLAGRLLPWWAIGMSVVATDIGAYDFVGASGGAYRYGLVLANFDWIGCIPGMILAAFIFVPYYWRAGVYTIPEYLGRRYNDYVRAVEAILWGVFMICNLGIFLWTSAVMLKPLMGWSEWTSIIVTAAVVGIYTVSGGLSAVVITDVVQFIIMYVGGAALVVLGLWKVGGWSGLVEKVHSLGPQYADHFKLFLPVDTKSPYPWTGIMLGLTVVLATAYWIGNQAIIQRTLGAKSEWDAKAGMAWGAVMKLFIPVFIVFPGLIALALYPGLKNPDEALPILVRELLPPGLMGLVFAAFFAALMSTVDSYLNSAATLWTKDVYQRFIRKEAPDKHYLVLGRILTIVFVLLAVGFAPVTNKFPGIYVAMQTLLSFFQGPTLAILLLGMLWRRTTQWGGLAGLISGVAISASLFAIQKRIFVCENPFLYIAWWSFVGSLVVTTAVSLFTRPHSLEKLHGLVYGLVMKDKGIQEVLKQRAEG